MWNPERIPYITFRLGKGGCYFQNQSENNGEIVFIEALLPSTLLKDLKVLVFKAMKNEKAVLEKEKWNTNKVDIKMKFLRSSIIKALDKTCFFFPSFYCKVFKAELQYSQFLFYTRVKWKRVCYESEGRWSRWSVFAVHTNTMVSDFQWAAMGTEISLPEMWYSSGDQLRKVTDMLVITTEIGNSSGRMKFHEIIN